MEEGEIVSSEFRDNDALSGRQDGRRFQHIQNLQRVHAPVVIDDGLYAGLASLQPVTRPRRLEEDMFPYEDANACEACRGINVHALLSANGYRHKRLAMVIVSGRDGCKICGLLLDELTKYGRLGFERSTNEPVVLRLANASGTPYCQDQVWVKAGKLSAIIGLYTDEGR